ncbi:hypothetical protein CR513_43344, partial [Mucuna pruriens]
MPFRLKNAGATYQQLMDKIFNDIMGHDVEAYIDNIVVKLPTAKEHYDGLERRYEKIEKVALVLIVTSRRLCPYFKSNHIIVRTDLPIKQVLRKSVLAKRMVWWKIKLSEFDISFKRRGHIKAQALTDFITELAPIGHNKSSGGEWFLFIDGASNQKGSGASANNNQVEYETLLAIMKLAKELEA